MKLVVLTTLVTVTLSLAALGCSTPKPRTFNPKAPPFVAAVEGHGSPVILIPGLGCTAEVWQSTVARYRDTHEMHVLTLAGFGGNAPIAPPFMEKERDAIAAYIRDKKLEKPVIIGHSMGGVLAMWIAAGHPDLVGQVVSIDGVPYLPAVFNSDATPNDTRFVAKLMRDRYASMTQEELVREFGKSIETMVKSPKDAARITEWTKTADPGAVGDAMGEMFQIDLRPEMAKISAPLLLIGSFSDLGEAKATKYAAAVKSQLEPAKNHRFVETRTARHFIMFDDPALIFAQLDTVLASR